MCSVQKCAVCRLQTLCGRNCRQDSAPCKPTEPDSRQFWAETETYFATQRCPIFCKHCSVVAPGGENAQEMKCFLCVFSTSVSLHIWWTVWWKAYFALFENIEWKLHRASRDVGLASDSNMDCHNIAFLNRKQLMMNRNAPIVLFLLLIRYFARRSIVGTRGPEGWSCRTAADHVSQKLKPIWNVGRWVGGGGELWEENLARIMWYCLRVENLQYEKEDRTIN